MPFPLDQSLSPLTVMQFTSNLCSWELPRRNKLLPLLTIRFVVFSARNLIVHEEFCDWCWCLESLSFALNRQMVLLFTTSLFICDSCHVLQLFFVSLRLDWIVQKKIMFLNMLFFPHVGCSVCHSRTISSFMLSV